MIKSQCTSASHCLIFCLFPSLGEKRIGSIVSVYVRAEDAVSINVEFSVNSHCLFNALRANSISGVNLKLNIFHSGN